MEKVIDKLGMSLPAQIVYGSECLSGAVVAELVRVEITVQEVLSLILGAQAWESGWKQQTLLWMQGSRGLDARGLGLTFSGIHFFLLF